MDTWVQLAVQVPLIAAFIYFVLERGKQDAAERKDRNEAWLSDLRLRDEQWRAFLRQRDEQWGELLQQMQGSFTVQSAATIEQLKANEKQLQAVGIEIRSSQIKYAQLEQMLLVSLNDINNSLRTKPRESNDNRGSGNK